MPRFISFWVVLFALLSAASAQEPTGHTVAVVPDASAFNASGVRLLSSQQSVFMGDRLQTGPVGEAQLQFIDETRLVVGPSASLVIDSFIVKENTHQPHESSSHNVAEQGAACPQSRSGLIWAKRFHRAEEVLLECGTPPRPARRRSQSGAGGRG